MCEESEISCRRCQCRNLIKKGRRSISQLYKCKNCNFIFTQYDGRTSIEKARKRIAILITYEELRLSISEIANLCKLKEKTIERWIEKEKNSTENHGLKIDNHYYESIKEILRAKKEKENRILLKKMQEEFAFLQKIKQQEMRRNKIKHLANKYPFLTQSEEFWTFEAMNEMYKKEGGLILLNDEEIEELKKEKSQIEREKISTYHNEIDLQMRTNNIKIKNP